MSDDNDAGLDGIGRAKEKSQWMTDPWQYSSWDGHRFSVGEAACGRCKFWERIIDDDIGQCRRYAPRATAAFDELKAAFEYAKLVNEETTEISRWAYWPQTSNYDWCGEFMPRTGPAREMPR